MEELELFFSLSANKEQTQKQKINSKNKHLKLRYKWNNEISVLKNPGSNSADIPFYTLHRFYKSTLSLCESMQHPEDLKIDLPLIKIDRFINWLKS